MGDKTSFIDAYANIEDGVKEKVNKFNNAKTGLNICAAITKIGLHNAIFTIRETTTITGQVVKDSLNHAKGICNVLRGDKYLWKK